MIRQRMMNTNTEITLTNAQKTNFLSFINSLIFGIFTVSSVILSQKLYPFTNVSLHPFKSLLVMWMGMREFVM